MNQKGNQQTDLNYHPKKAEKVSELGTLLRGEREKKGLSYEEVSRITRLRPYILEALENEDWDKLPASVFIKGFIRSYAQALGLDKKRPLEIYRRIAPPELATPKPLIDNRKNTKSFFFILVMILGVIGAVIYLWNGYRSPQMAPIQIKKEIPPVDREKPTNEARGPILKDHEPGSIKEQELSFTTPMLYKDIEEGQRPEDSLSMKEPIIYTVIDPITGMADITDRHVLKGIVTARTWMRIYIDDQEPKEYIFQPGSRPLWNAKEGFKIIIGNAAGIEFDFNGKRIANLGDIGQVVNLILPKDLNITTSED